MKKEEAKFYKINNNEVFRYLVIGVCTTFINYIIFLVLCYLTFFGNTDTGVTAANIISIAVAILFAFFANKYVVFKSETSGATGILCEMIRFVAARLATMAIEVAGVYLLVSAAGMEPFLGKMLVQIIVVIGNYFISRHLVFK